MTASQHLTIEDRLVELMMYAANLPGSIYNQFNWHQIVRRAEELTMTLPEHYQLQLADLLVVRPGGIEDLLPKSSRTPPRLDWLNNLTEYAPSEPARSLLWLTRERFLKAKTPQLFSSGAPYTKCLWCDNLPRPYSDQCLRCFAYDCARSIRYGYGDD